MKFKINFLVFIWANLIFVAKSQFFGLRYGESNFCECKSIYECPSLFNLVERFGILAGPLLRQSFCYYEYTTPHVCCPMTTRPATVRPLIRPILQPTITPPIFGRNNQKQQSQNSIFNDNTQVTTEQSPKIKELQKKCGFSNAGHYRFIDGAPAELGAWPWVVALGYGKPNNQNVKWLCGGNLISDKHIVTAAHCAFGRRDLYTVRLGEHNISNSSDGANPIDIFIENIFIHPNYNPSNSMNDIAVLTLQQPVQFSESIHPICLPLLNDLQKENLTGHHPFIAGWGANHNGLYDPSLLESQVKVIPTEECSKIFKKTKILINSNNLCTKLYVSKFKGDSGGNLMYPKIDTFYTLGVAIGHECENNGNLCIVAFTKIIPHLKFILDIINRY